MAFLAYDPNMDPNKKQQEEQGAVNVSGASTAINQPPGSNQPQAGKPKSSGQFTNIQGYLNANKEQAGQMGSTIANKVETGAQDAQSNIGKLAGEKQSVGAVDPNKYLADPINANKQEYQALRQTGGYTGPNDISQTQNYQTALKSTENAAGMVKNASTDDGRMNLLQEQYKRPSYSRGMQKLDQVLVQNDAATKQKFADINQKYSGLTGMLDNTATEVGQSIKQAKTDALANKTAIATAEDAAKKSLLDPIQTRAAEANAKNPELINRITQDASDEILSDETLGLLGLSEGQDLFDLNLQSYLTPDKTQVGLDNVATAEERQRYAGLASLLGDPTMGQITKDGKAINPVAFNKDQFGKDIAGRTAAAEAAKKAFGVNVTPTVNGGFSYDNPFNSNNLTYDQYASVADAAEQFFSKFNTSYGRDGNHYDNAQYKALRQGLLDAAVKAGVANNSVYGDAPMEGFLLGMENARGQFNNLNKNYSIGRKVKKG